MSTPMRETSRFFRATVARVTDLTPSFRRFTFTGPELDQYGDTGWDQRVKLVFPSRSVGIDALPTGPDWFTAWRALDEARRPPFRTYTTRAVRHAEREVDIDMVVHEVQGPASAWIQRARPGDDVLIFAPTTAHDGIGSGIDFVPPARVEDFLLAGDETAAPAIAVILEQLPATARGVVAVEVPEGADRSYLPSHPGFELEVSARGDGERHARLIRSVTEIAAERLPEGRGAQVEEIDIDTQLLWEVPRTAKGGAALTSAPLYAWLAGEAAGIKTLRRHLVADRGVDRRAVAFMGYWRRGRAEV